MLNFEEHKDLFVRGNFSNIDTIEKAIEVKDNIATKYKGIIPNHVFEVVNKKIAENSTNLEEIQYQLSYLYVWVERADDYLAEKNAK